MSIDMPKVGTGRDGADAVRLTAGNHALTFLGRVGLAAYGVVYLLVGYLAVKIAVDGGHGGNADRSGALHALAAQPGGVFVLWVVTIGLVALVIWQLAEAIWGYRAASSRRRKLRRLASLGQATVFATVAFSAAKVAVTGGSGGAGTQQKALTAKVLELPMGQVLVGAVGVGVIVVAAYLVVRGLRQKFTEDLDLARASRSGRKAAVRLGQIGYTALGVAYGIVGVLVVTAAATFDPDKAAGLDQALSTLARQPHGTVLLGAVAAGVGCYGIYCLFDARYRHE